MTRTWSLTSLHFLAVHRYNHLRKCTTEVFKDGKLLPFQANL